MSGAIPPLPLYASMAWTGTTFSIFTPFVPYDPVRMPSVKSVASQTFLVAISEQVTALYEPCQWPS